MQEGQAGRKWLLVNLSQQHSKAAGCVVLSPVVALKFLSVKCEAVLCLALSLSVFLFPYSSSRREQLNCHI